MGFLDKIQDGLNQGQQKLDAVQNKKQIDGQLTNLGKWVYATRTGQDGGRGEAEIDIALQHISTLVGQYGMFDLPYPTPSATGGTAAGAPPAQPAAFPVDPEAPPPAGFPAPPAGGPPAAGAPPSTGGLPPGMGGGPPPGMGGQPPGTAAPPPAAPPAPAAEPGERDDVPDAPPPGFGAPPPGGG